MGGLLMIQDNGDTFLPAYDAMGNLHALMTADSATIDGTSYSAGDIVAAYEYDAFGRTIRESGAYAASNPFRFSTKYADVETGLVYYGHRYYSPDLGRFINRDPIEEQGGVNLYAFVRNNAVNAWDYLGMIYMMEPFIVSESKWVDGPLSVYDSGGGGGLGGGRSSRDVYNENWEPGPDPRFYGKRSRQTDPEAEKRDQEKLEEVQKTLDEGGTVTVIDANGQIVTLGGNTGLSVSVTFGNGEPSSAGGDEQMDSNYNQSQGGPWHYSGNYRRVDFTNSLDANDAARNIAQDFLGFRSFNTPTVNAAIVIVSDGQAVFYLGANGPDTPGFLQGYGSNIINDSGARVNLSSGWNIDGSRFTQTAVTVGGHQLIGTRQWVVSVSGNSVTYGTFAYEQPRPALLGLNGIGFALGGERAQNSIWNTYLDNIAKNAGFSESITYSGSWSNYTVDNPLMTKF